MIGFAGLIGAAGAITILLCNSQPAWAVVVLIGFIILTVMD